MFIFEDYWKKIKTPDLENLAFDISEIFWFHRSQVQPTLLISWHKFVDRHGALAKEIVYPSAAFDVDQGLFYKASQRALADAIALNICRKRVWDLVFMAQRRHGDIAAILGLVQASSNPAMFAHRGHHNCTDEFCEFSDENSAMKRQLHKCSSQSCDSIGFPVEKLAKVILEGRKIEWKVIPSSKGVLVPTLISVAEWDMNSDVYKSETLAISHVWSDGTGVGVKRLGEVNECLLAFFFDLAKSLECSGLWWDTICVPTATTDEEKKARSIAISKMHENYANAKHMVIHDEYLLQIDWAEDGSPAVALVLSPWFSRGWTALELSLSRSVKVLYRDPDDHSKYVMKDLVKDVLADGPFERLGHIAASQLIQKLTGRPTTLMDLITILSTRSTSWNRDRMAIAGLLARVENFDYNSPRAEATRKILKDYAVFDRSLLHHGQVSMVDQGPWSWCPSNVLLSPQELLKHWNPVVSDTPHQARFCFDGDGSVIGHWSCTILNEKSIDGVKPLATHWNVYRVLDEVPPESLVILHSEAAHLPDLLVVATGITPMKESAVDCHYAGCVRTESGYNNSLATAELGRSPNIYRFKIGTKIGNKPRPARLFLDECIS